MPLQSLQEIRNEWEKGLKQLSVINYGCSVLVILENNGGYHCHRYFQINDNWVCSVDGQNVPLGAVWKWLNNPSAIEKEMT